MIEKTQVYQIFEWNNSGVSRESETVISDVTDMLVEVKYVRIKSEWKLIVIGFSGFRIYSEDGKSLILSVKLSQFYQSNQIASINNHSFNGVCLMKCSDATETICIGSTIGHIYFAECLGSQKFQASIGLQLETCKKITCLAASEIDHLLIACSQEGEIHIFMANGLKDLAYIKKLHSNTNGTPINSMAVLERKKISPNHTNLLVCGDSLGQIIIYDLNEYCLITTINSHARMITQIDCNHVNSEILSCSEDSYINVWKAPPGSKDISLSFSLSINDLCIVGSAFANPFAANSPIFVTCYDQEEIHVVQRKL